MFRDAMIANLRKTRADIDADQEARRQRESDPMYETPRSWRRRPSVQKSGNGLDLVYRTQENAMVGHHTAEPAPSDGADWAEAISMALAAIRRDYGQQIAKLEREIIELRGKLDAALTIIGKSGGTIIKP
jgi:hypothetical protein